MTLSETPSAAAHRVVLDTNIVLDLWVFADPAADALRDAITAAQLQWISTLSMRDELERVLGYAQIAPRLAFHRRIADDVLAAFDAHARVHPPAPKADVTCKDPDDQKFIDLAVAHGALLLSKDALVLALRKRLRMRGADAQRHWPGASATAHAMVTPAA